jgi:hypothetical protein
MNFQQGLTRARSPAFDKFCQHYETLNGPAPPPPPPPELLAESITNLYILATLEYSMILDDDLVDINGQLVPFILPPYETVRNAVHDSPPASMPDDSANPATVRYFIYRILTLRDSEAIKGIPLACSHPRVIIDTIERWHDGGHALNVATGTRCLVKSFDDGIHSTAGVLVASVLWTQISRIYRKKSSRTVYPRHSTPPVGMDMLLSNHQEWLKKGNNTASAEKGPKIPSKRRRKEKVTMHFEENNHRVSKPWERTVRRNEKRTEREAVKKMERKSRKSKEDCKERMDSMQPSPSSSLSRYSLLNRMMAHDQMAGKMSTTQKCQHDDAIGLDKTRHAKQTMRPFRHSEEISTRTTADSTPLFRYVTDLEAEDNGDERWQVLRDDGLDPFLSPLAEADTPTKSITFEQLVENMMGHVASVCDTFRRRQSQPLTPAYDPVPSMWKNLGDGLKEVGTGVSSGVREFRRRRHDSATSIWSGIAKSMPKVVRVRKSSNPPTEYVSSTHNAESPETVEAYPRKSFWRKRRSFVCPGQPRSRQS